MTPVAQHQRLPKHRTRTRRKPGIRKAATHIRGLDDITRGGLPRGRATLLAGGPGCGKTVLALQTLVKAAATGEPGIFVAFEEDSSRIVANAASFGWNLPELEKKDLFFLDAKPRPDVVCAGEFDLSSLLAGLKIKAEQMGARRIVFDSIDVLLTLLDNPQAERRELFRLNDWLVSGGLTGIITCKSRDSAQSSLNYQDFMQYLVDCVIFLRHDQDNRVALRTLRIVKYRGSGFYAGEVALSLGDTGAEVMSFPQAPALPVASTERISSGVARLDSMLCGGYYRGSAILLSGAPGTAKTTLAGAFILAACQRGEPALMVGYDEPAQEIVRNLRSVGIDLGPHVDSGLLRIESIRSSQTGAEEHIGALRKLLEAQQPRCFVIDPLSAILNIDADAGQRRLPEQLLELTKAAGVTLLCTSLLSGTNALDEGSSIQVSTVADTWIHISYAVLAGERNRALTIIKSRGTGHSNQVRELILDAGGITLADVYQAGGEVLMGTARWQKETAERVAEDKLQAMVANKRRELELARAEVNARIAVLQREMAVKSGELELFLASEASRLQAVDQTREALWHLRSGDDQKPSAAP
ncbi:MAG: circadian clock protein KaiC [Comamonadaceae bacterium]|nr:circadian clock protein KaiC [Comamonadaceae bacterium]